MKTCPNCSEEIQDAAIVCRYCGRDLPGSSQGDSKSSVKKDKLAGLVKQSISKSKSQLKVLEEKLALWEANYDVEYDRLVKAEKTGRSISSIVAPLSRTFQGEQEFTEENRAQVIADWRKNDVNAKSFRRTIELSGPAIEAGISLLDDLENDRIDISRYDDLIDHYESQT